MPNRVCLKEKQDQYDIIVNDEKLAHIHKNREFLQIHINTETHKQFEIKKLEGTKEIVIVFHVPNNVKGIRLYQSKDE